MEIGGIVLCWFLFGASHMALSSLKLRPKRVGVLGDPGVTLAIRWFHSSLFGGARTRSAEPEHVRRSLKARASGSESTAIPSCGDGGSSSGSTAEN